ncbi:MATN1-like protein [Mya arenaria]|uniref:MATN1-like protein n=1 Tax=Mya arenaria TaxID=6604 RepID=A0ABY7GDU7_MYAAR|nr:MATN1-like protein [Mya arenaria]
MNIVAIVVFLAATLLSVTNAIDKTLQPNAYGADVVEAVVNVIRDSCLFAEDRRFLRRLAYVDENEFRATQNKPLLQSQYNLILSRFGITWNAVRWQDLRRPLYSGIAAALFSIYRAGPSGMSWKLEEQGLFWGHNFHGGRPANNFTQLAQILDLGCKTNQQVDLVFVVDTSSSLTANDFTRSIRFLSEVVDGFEISPYNTQVGLVTYSSTARVEFHLNQHTNNVSLHNAINGVHNVPGATQTDKAIDKAITEVFSSGNGARPGAVKVMVVITDGNSDDDLNTLDAANKAHAAGVVTFSVGVGTSIGKTELDNIATDPDCTHAYTVKGYDEIKFLREEIQKATCIVPSLGGAHRTKRNPYPSGAQYETIDYTYMGNMSQHFFSTGGVTVRCYKDGVEILCKDEYFNCTEKWNFNSPCTNANILAGITKFPHPYNNNKFLMCDLSGKMYIVICPPRELYFKDCSQCLGENSVSSSGCGTSLAPTVANPCSRAQILAGDEWDQGLLTCFVASTYSPCRHHVPGTPYLYPHQCDPHQYIHCDTNHQSFVQSCQLDYVFLKTTQTCVPKGQYGTDTYYNTCGGSTTPQYYATTAGQIGPTAGYNGGYTYSTQLWQSPCTHANIANNELYFPVTQDLHKYIQCDLNGRQYLRTCSGSGRDFYDPISHTCVDGPVFVDNIIEG